MTRRPMLKLRKVIIINPTHLSFRRDQRDGQLLFSHNHTQRITSTLGSRHNLHQPDDTTKKKKKKSRRGRGQVWGSKRVLFWSSILFIVLNKCGYFRFCSRYTFCPTRHVSSVIFDVMSSYRNFFSHYDANGLWALPSRLRRHVTINATRTGTTTGTSQVFQLQPLCCL